jgi:hypothetical protein
MWAAEAGLIETAPFSAYAWFCMDDILRRIVSVGAIITAIAIPIGVLLTKRYRTSAESIR